MAFVPTPNTVQLACLGTRISSAQRIVNVYHYRYSLAPSVAVLAGAASAWAANVVPKILPVLSSDYRMNELRLRDLGSATGASYVYPLVLGATTGGRTGDGMPSNCALTVSWRTGRVGRSYRGRTYYGPFWEGDNTHDLMGATVTNGLNALASYLVTYQVGAAWGLAVRSEKLHISTQILSYIVEAYVDSQRRRLTGRGR